MVRSLDSAPRSTLRSAVVDSLRGAIDEGELPPGTHLGEVELSQRLGVSRATLREAMRELQQEGILVQDGRGRVSVREIDEQQIRDLFEVRSHLEQLALRRLCSLDDRSEAVRALRAILGGMASPASVTDGIRADLRFHEALPLLAGNDILLRTWQGLAGLIHLTMTSSGIAPSRAEQTVERHAPIVDAVEAGDAEAACDRLSAHMADALAYIVGQRADRDQTSR
ncbi:GntR family transcriptional regulator [Microbacterium sp. NPDC055683]